MSLIASFHPYPLLAMDNHKQKTETTHIAAHGTTILDVVYTNKDNTMEQILAKYEQWLA